MTMPLLRDADITPFATRFMGHAKPIGGQGAARMRLHCGEDSPQKPIVGAVVPMTFAVWGEGMTQNRFFLERGSASAVQTAKNGTMEVV